MSLASLPPLSAFVCLLLLPCPHSSPWEKQCLFYLSVKHPINFSCVRTSNSGGPFQIPPSSDDISWWLMNFLHMIFLRLMYVILLPQNKRIISCKITILRWLLLSKNVQWYFSDSEFSLNFEVVLPWVPIQHWSCRVGSETCKFTADISIKQHKRWNSHLWSAGEKW